MTDTDLREQLRQHGARRREALETAAAELAAIAELAADAIASGVPKIELAELAGISRPTLDALLKRS